MFNIWTFITKNYVEYNEGLTIWTMKKPQFKGYLVAIKMFERIILDDEENKQFIIQQYFVKHCQHGAAIGLWHDTETNRIYLDVVEHYDRKSVAMCNARLHDQLAIWDIENECEIRVNETHLIP